MLGSTEFCNCHVKNLDSTVTIAACFGQDLMKQLLKNTCREGSIHETRKAKVKSMENVEKV
jgi:hypothetical protein